MLPDVLQWAVVLPFELVVAGQVVEFWDTNVPQGAWITIFFLFIFVSVFVGGDYMRVCWTPLFVRTAR